MKVTVAGVTMAVATLAATNKSGRDGFGGDGDDLMVGIENTWIVVTTMIISEARHSGCDNDIIVGTAIACTFR